MHQGYDVVPMSITSDVSDPSWKTSDWHAEASIRVMHVGNARKDLVLRMFGLRLDDG